MFLPPCWLSSSAARVAGILRSFLYPFLRWVLTAAAGLALVIPAVAPAGEPPVPGLPRVSTAAIPWSIADSAAASGDGTAVLAEITEASPTMARIRERGRIVLGYRQTAVPFSYVDAQDQPMGLAWALCQRVVQALQREMAMPDLRITPVRVIEQMRGPLIKGDAIDIDCAPSTVTATRERQVAFSLPYYAANVRLMVRQGAGIRSIDDMRGLRLAVVQGTTAERLVRARHARAGFQLLMARDYDDAFRMLREHRAQALALDDVLLEGLRATSKSPDAFRIVGPPLATQPEHYALALPKDDPAFKTRVDAALADIFRSDGMRQLQRESLQTAVPPFGHVLRVVPSPDVLAIWEAGARYGVSADGITHAPEHDTSAASSSPRG
ncbi:amino acid ABC transporter substrate-binding protein [Pandoraea sp. XJJ-1]|uniref:amino acid ABC transporter substrate-binding protein n=1 Tax=Pandoraea sp. XJJ-1 TaxID=3002643 RepID=UPI00228006B2|nr:amino acid ABC transporter substrate-binding protein [Pandoraea sp. XJJ-1]WAL81095.1 amino acid ABC transporter substrate-binding protein [Pandoraea sp. XJJ-1]